MIKILVVSLALSLLGGCAAVTVTESGAADFRYRPNYEERKHFFLWGLIGDHRVNTQEICKERPVKQMQSKFLGLDVFYTALTGGLYVARTARVWCKRTEEL